MHCANKKKIDIVAEKKEKCLKNWLVELSFTYQQRKGRVMLCKFLALSLDMIRGEKKVLFGKFPVSMWCKKTNCSTLISDNNTNAANEEVKVINLNKCAKFLTRRSRP